uniref:Uncharacterized protein n=1 Tax=Rhizophora mucronata TaxID=61149 RepID=A0A2P2LT42_RHIMU
MKSCRAARFYGSPIILMLKSSTPNLWIFHSLLPIANFKNASELQNYQQKQTVTEQIRGDRP